MTAVLGPVDFGFGEVTLERYPELTVHRLHVRAVKEPIEDGGINTLLTTLDEVLARGEPLTILWDVRNCSIPSRAQIKIALDWIGANSHLLDKHLQGIAVCLSSLIVRSILNFILSITKPPQPNGVFADEAEAFGFARDKCTEVREWVGRKKKKQLEAAAGQPDSPDGTKPRGSPRLLSLGRQNSKKSNASGDSESSP